MHVQLNAARQQATQAERARARLQRALETAEASERLQHQQSQQLLQQQRRSGLHSPGAGNASGPPSMHEESLQCAPGAVTCAVDPDLRNIGAV